MAPWEPAQYLAPYIGGLLQKGLSLAASKGLKLFTTLFGRQKLI